MLRYDLDLAKIPLDDYLALLKRQTLLPSRRMLLDDADDRFTRISAQGISSVAQLLTALSTRVKIEAFAAQSNVPSAYLTVLRREAGTLRQKPVPLGTFPGIGAAEIEALETLGIKTSKDCFERCAPGGRLHALCGLVRINGVGPSAAAMFYAAGYHTAAAIADEDVRTLLARITAANAGGRYYAGKLGEKDMRFCIESARLLLRLES